MISNPQCKIRKHIMNNSVLLIARILMSFMFIMGGFSKIGDVSGFAQFMASGGIPAFLAWPAILFEIFAGLFILVGFQTRYTAWALAAFCVVTALLYHFDPSNQMQMTNMFKNLTMAGGYLALSVAGAGAYSLDAKRSKSARA